MSEIESMETGEESQIRRAIFTLLQECPLIPDTISVKYGETEMNSVGIFSQKTEKTVIKQFVSGAYDAQLPFLLRYKTAPVSDNDRINAEELLAGVAEWMCRSQTYPTLSGDRRITKMEMGSVYSDKKQEDNTINYEVTINMKYTKGSK